VKENRPVGLSTRGCDRWQEVGDDFGARLGAEIAFAVDADAGCIGFHVAFADHEHGASPGEADSGSCPPRYR
jgi:hypothetical protein